MLRGFAALFVWVAMATASLFTAELVALSAHDTIHTAQHYRDSQSSGPLLQSADCPVCLTHRLSSAMPTIAVQLGFERLETPLVWIAAVAQLLPPSATSFQARAPPAVSSLG